MFFLYYMNKPSKKVREAVKKSCEICNILCRSSGYGYGRKAVMSFIREEIKCFLIDYVAHNNCAINPFNCEIDDDAINEDVAISLPCCYISWLTAYGSFSVRYYNRDRDRKKSGEKADVSVSSDAFMLFYDFDENKNYGNVKEEYFNKYYKRSPEQIYDYLETVTCKRLIDNLKNFYDKRLVSCNEIKPLKGVDIETNKECIQEPEEYIKERNKEGNVE